MAKKQDKKTERMHVKQTLGIYVRTAWRYRRDFLLTFGVTVSSVTFGVIMPFLASKVLADLIIHSDALWNYFYLLIAAAIFGLSCNVFGIRAQARVQARASYDLHLMVFDRLMRRSASFYNNQIGGKLVSDALDFIVGFGQLANVALVTALGFAATTVIGLIVVFISNWIIGICLLILLLILGMWTYYDNLQRSSIRSARLKVSKQVTGHLSDNIVNAITVKTFAMEAYEHDKAEVLSKKLEHIRIRDWMIGTTKETQRIGLLLFTQIILIFVLIKLTAKDPSILAAGIFAFTYTITLISRFFTIGTMVRQIEEVFLQASPLTEILQQPDEITDAPDASLLLVDTGKIYFVDVNFKYTDAPEGQFVFENLNLAIGSGEKIGLVGHSGGGKTTFTRLLLRFDDITSGQILIDGQEIRAVTQSSLRQNIAYVPQEPLLFHRSVCENIAYANPHASIDEVENAAKMAYAHEFIQELPEGYDTIVGERGVKLSGGQRQRIAIARAILKDAPILVLDEATSALDSESENYIQKALWNLMENRTTIVVAHRLSTIQKMDRIIVMSNGRITEEGPHKELIQQDGIYADLWNRQSGGFIEE